MDNKYNDIINLPHYRSKKRQPMSLHDRAAQFSPFSALTGHDEAIKETARLTDKKTELSETTKTILNEIILPFYTKQHTTLINKFIYAVTSIPHDVCPSESSNYDINRGLVYIKLNQILIRNIALLNKTQGIFFKTIFDIFINTMFSYLNTNDNNFCLECNTLILTSIKLYNSALLNNDERNILNCVLPRNNEKYNYIINECLKCKTFDGLIMLFNKYNVDFVPLCNSDTILEKMIYFIMKYSSNAERCKYMIVLGLNRVMRMDIKWLFRIN